MREFYKIELTYEDYFRGWCWCARFAGDEGDEEGRIILGSGRTPQAAVDELISLWCSRYDGEEDSLPAPVPRYIMRLWEERFPALLERGGGSK